MPKKSDSQPHSAEQELGDKTEEEALQLNAGALIPEKSQEETRGLIERLKRGEQVPPYEIKVSLTISTLLDESGNPASVATTEKEI